ncbi:hypothetical protein [[Clostridium] colinum]|uniref:hypothetical protein n=1 Tax=[Clostridium] colinum TaxID=36835 RepID=UPI00202413C5|nr:hypothetical protein [[Clostridium] colinum]
MNIFSRNLKNRNNNTENYYNEVQEYTIIAQKMLSISLFIFFIFYIPIINFIEFIDNGSFNPTTKICLLQCFLSLMGYILFKYYFPNNKKFSISFAYINVIQIIVLLEVQFFYTVILFHI